MNKGDIINILDKGYIVLAVKSISDKNYALITEFDANINFKEKTIKDADIDLKKALLVSFDIEANSINFETDINIISELIECIYEN